MIDKFIKEPYNFFHFERKISTEQDTTDFHLHTHLEIYVFIHGNTEVFLESGVYKLNAGQVVLFNTADIHKLSRAGDGVYERYIIHFDPRLVDFLDKTGQKLLKNFYRKSHQPVTILTPTDTQRKRFYNLLNYAEESLNSSRKFQEITILSILFELLVQINSMNLLSYSIEGTKQELPDVLKEILNYIEDNFTQDLSLDKLSDLFNINKFYLSKIFKKHVGSSIHQLIIFKRISYAKELLAHGETVTATCFKTGFSDYSNFIKQFKKIVGMAPGKYKTTLKNKDKMSNIVGVN